MKMPVGYLVLVVLVVGCAFLAGCDTIATEAGEELRASGIVEADELTIASEVGGRVMEVLVGKGDQVSAGQPVFRLEKEMLQAERKRLLAAGEQAIAAADLQLLIAQQAYEDLLDKWPVIAAQAQLTYATAQDELEEAERHRTNQQEGNRGNEVTVNASRAELTIAKDAMEEAKHAYDRTPGDRTEDPGKAMAYKAYAAAKQRYDAALRSYNWYTGHPDEVDQAILDAEVASALANVEDARLDWEEWKDGPNQDDLDLARANIANAEAQLALAIANAEVELETIDLQLGKYLILAPAAGTVLNSSIEKGEVILAGVPAMTLGRLDELKITVYVPENRYGVISLGDRAVVTVDSFPGKEFVAVVVGIADEAEFTPRNVQTEEERRTTVFAVELIVDDPGGRLKPGMPADVVFPISAE